MAKIGDLALTGVSGKQYSFSVYPLNTEFKALGGVYYFSIRTTKPDGGGNHTPLYIGQTSDLSSRFTDHHKEACMDSRGVNCISVHVDQDEDSRLAKEQDLIAAYNPPCNG